MTSRHLLAVLVLASSIGGGFLGLAGSANAQSLSATPGPQQMVPYGSPEAYPATHQSTYPSTATPLPQYPALPPYNSVPAASASAAIAAGGVAMNTGPDQFGPAGTQSSEADVSVATGPMDIDSYVERALVSDEPWVWQVVPSGLMYKSYSASGHEPRFAGQWVHVRDQGWLWDVTLGGRAGLIRYGDASDIWPQGWQLDIEGAAFPRLDTQHQRDVISNDYRFGVPLTTRQGPWEAKFGYYHISSHIADEYLINHQNFDRINYVRESLVMGLAFYLNPSLRLYSEADWAFYADDGAEPWHFQFGADFSSTEPTGFGGSPFFAVNGQLRQENDFGGNVTVQTGWQWRGRSGHLCRIGMQYSNGMSNQYQFYREFEEQIGAGIWYDY